MPPILATCKPSVSRRSRAGPLVKPEGHRALRGAKRPVIERERGVVLAEFEVEQRCSASGYCSISPGMHHPGLGLGHLAMITLPGLTMLRRVGGQAPQVVQAAAVD
jgi:hypothetical protein